MSLTLKQKTLTLYWHPYMFIIVFLDLFCKWQKQFYSDFFCLVEVFLLHFSLKRLFSSVVADVDFFQVTTFDQSWVEPRLEVKSSGFEPSSRAKAWLGSSSTVHKILRLSLKDRVFRKLTKLQKSIFNFFQISKVLFFLFPRYPKSLFCRKPN